MYKKCHCEVCKTTINGCHYDWKVQLKGLLDKMKKKQGGENGKA